MSGGSIVGRVGGTIAMITLLQAAVLLAISIVAFRSQVAVARVHLVEEGIALALLAAEPAREGEGTVAHLDRLAPLSGFAIALYDHEGRLLHATRDDVEMLRTIEPALRTRADARPTEAVIVRGSPDEPTAALAAFPVEAPGAARYLGLFEENSAQQVARGRLYVFVALSIGVVLFVLLLTVWLTTRARASLREIEAVVHRMADGDLSVRLPVRSDDEVGRVVGDFNRMADALAARLEEVRRAEAQLRRTEAQRSRLFAAFTHELSTPLTSVLGYLESLQMPEIDGDPDTRHRYVEIAFTQARALDALAEDLATLSRLDFEGLALCRSRVDLGALARAEIAPFEPRAAEKKVTITLGAAPDLVADVDPQRCGQVLRILLDNALRHTPEGSTISVDLTRLEDERASLVVRDGGPGVPEAHLDRLGEPLYRLDASRTRGTGGRGLGLSIARGIARTHGGELTFASPPGSGLVATVTLPLRVD